MGNYSIQTVTPEAVYVSCLTHRLETNAEGWTRWCEVDHQRTSSGCVILDRMLDLIDNEGGIQIYWLAERMQVRPQDLAGVVRIMTGMEAKDFIRAYQLLRAKEYLSSTELTIPEVAEKLGFHSPQTFINSFQDQVGITPASYRRRKRPADYRARYRW